MRRLITLLGLATAALAQQPAAKTFTSAPDVTAMIQKARNERKPDQANFIQPLLQAAPYTVNLEYRVKAGARSVIVCETENFSVDESWLSQQPSNGKTESQLYLSERWLLKKGK